MNSPASSLPRPGTYKFVVGSAAEAVTTIQARLGSMARVLSVSAQPRTGLSRWLKAPRFAVVAELPSPVPVQATAQPAAKAASGAAQDNFVENPPPSALTENLSHEPANDAESRLATVLRRAGFSARMLGRLEAAPGWRAAAAKPLQQALADLGRELHAMASRQPVRPLPARTAFFGAPGAGSTTALCKWLAREVCQRAAHGQVWKVEFDRPNPAPALGVFCEAMGVPMEHYTPGASVADDGFLLVDLPGLPPPGVAPAPELRKFLERERIEGRVLVLNAAYDGDGLRAAQVRGRELGATHLVLTHLDEVPRWGRLWEVLLEGDLCPLFLSSGRALTGDLDTEVIGAVLRRTLPANAAA